jgi:hypothetical protein
VTILTSLLGTKIFGLIVLMWQAAGAAPAASPEAADHFSIMSMIKSMGGVAIGVVIVVLIMSVY